MKKNDYKVYPLYVHKGNSADIHLMLVNLELHFKMLALLYCQVWH